MRRGEVWLVNLDPTLGAEMRKTRPAVIVSSDLVGILPLRIIVPLTDWKERYGAAPWMVRVNANPLNGLEKDSAADCFQVRSLSTSLRIEDGRRAEGFGFSSVSADVVRLSRLITAKFDAILTRANNLNDTVRFAKKREHDFLKAQGAHASDLLGKTRASLNYMADL